MLQIHFCFFSTKASHLEVVQDLSTCSFISALRRFIATRANPKTIWSDNATNFVGAKNELIELKKNFLTQQHQFVIHSSLILWMHLKTGFAFNACTFYAYTQFMLMFGWLCSTSTVISSHILTVCSPKFDALYILRANTNLIAKIYWKRLDRLFE